MPSLGLKVPEIDLTHASELVRDTFRSLQDANSIVEVGAADRELRERLGKENISGEELTDLLVCRRVIEKLMAPYMSRAISRFVRLKGVGAFGEMMAAASIDGSHHCEACDLAAYEPLQEVLVLLEAEVHAERSTSATKPVSAYYCAMLEEETIGGLHKIATRGEEDTRLSDEERLRLRRFYNECKYAIESQIKDAKLDGVVGEISDKLFQFVASSKVVAEHPETITEQNVGEIRAMIFHMTMVAIGNVISKSPEDGGMTLDDIKNIGSKPVEVVMKVDMKEIEARHPLVAKGIGWYFKRYVEAVDKHEKENKQARSHLYYTDEGVQVSESKYREMYRGGLIQNPNPRFLEREKAAAAAAEPMRVNLGR